MENRIEERIAELKKFVDRHEKWLAEEVEDLRKVEFKNKNDIHWAEEYMRKICERMNRIETAKALIDELEMLGK